MLSLMSFIITITISSLVFIVLILSMPLKLLIFEMHNGFCHHDFLLFSRFRKNALKSTLHFYQEFLSRGLRGRICCCCFTSCSFSSDFVLYRLRPILVFKLFFQLCNCIVVMLQRKLVVYDHAPTKALLLVV